MNEYDSDDDIYFELDWDEEDEVDDYPSETHSTLIAQCTEVFQWRLREYGADDKDTLIALAELGKALFRDGQLAPAVEYLSSTHRALHQMNPRQVTCEEIDVKWSLASCLEEVQLLTNPEDQDWQEILALSSQIVVYFTDHESEQRENLLRALQNHAERLASASDFDTSLQIWREIQLLCKDNESEDPERLLLSEIKIKGLMSRER